jgi:hypothetical protein
LPHPLPQIAAIPRKQLAGELRGGFFAQISSHRVLAAQAGEAIE